MFDCKPSPLGDRRVTLEHLRAFVLLAEGKGFQQAGLQLYRSQSAVTQSLKRLEEILDCKLLERRQGHIMGLTADGERFLPSAKEILIRTSEAVSAMKQPEMSGRLLVGVPDDFKVVDLHSAISRCAELNRNLRLEVVSALSSELISQIDSSGLDLVILKCLEHFVPSDNRWKTHPLRREPLYWVAAQRCAFDSLSEVPLVIFPDGCCYRNAALAALDKAGKHGYGAYVSASYENIRAAVSAGLGIGVLPESALAKDHAVLGEKEGFPELPMVELVMIQATHKYATRKLAEFLSHSTDIGSRYSNECGFGDVSSEAL
ncbi:DNA-binding transcriptional regulator, LysR family [Marinobacter persicus]|uniref:DNA-binding transcriptional regulator, LysR family n=1 Tax=Marinobacter persicus TaxID=930118 RepID=A0A1I3W6A9_9GAMM|nr:LysR family transcriptional regulator [Marinobacter persicus]GHD46895.1 transcriptional regulator [Marinobacter persicus]SFK03118.1 DNA-binding transcriptional regulator, LysR family [Marinobacter persicus]